jgi:hypothetical protein
MSSTSAMPQEAHESTEGVVLSSVLMIKNSGKYGIMGYDDTSE